MLAAPMHESCMHACMHESPMNLRPRSSNCERHARAYCGCWNKNRLPVSWSQLGACTCGEDNNVSEWKWEQPQVSGSSWVVVSEDKLQVTFHPSYSSGTAVARGDTPLMLNHHYYWEVKILSGTYGTDVMVGVGTNKVNTSDLEFRFTSFLGEDGESYGLSYRGKVHHNALISQETAGFCRGSIVGVRVDLWHGTLEFYLNRKPQGVSFYNLRRHPALYPMACSTAAQSSMRLIYAASWRASLLVDAAKILAASLRSDRCASLPPGLWYTCRSHFWLTLPTDGCNIDDDDESFETETMEAAKMATSVLSEVLPTPYMNGFYVDGVDRGYRLVVYGNNN